MPSSAVVLEVLGEVDRRHTPSTDLPLDGAPVGEGGHKAGEGVGHSAAALG